MSAPMTPEAATHALNDASDKLSDASDLLLVIQSAILANEPSPCNATLCTAINFASGALQEVAGKIDHALIFAKGQLQSSSDQGVLS